MALLPRLTRWGGMRASRRLGRSIPFLGAAIALALVSRSIRRKGVKRGLADTGLDAVPFVGVLKNVVEAFTGDWFPDRPGPRRTR